MSKEHEVIMLLNKGRDIMARFKKIENRSLQRDLEKMQSQWEKLKKDTLDKHTKLQTCVEHCKNFHKAQSIFLPWLRQAEDKFEKLKPSSYKRIDIENQLKELSSFRNEIWKKSGECEINISLGETLMAACDIDKDIVKNELVAEKFRWEELNNGKFFIFLLIIICILSEKYYCHLSFSKVEAVEFSFLWFIRYDLQKI